MAENYEPLEEAEVNIKYVNYSYGESFYIQPIKEPIAPKQSFVILKNVSSYLPQRTWINSHITGVFLCADTLWKNIFDPYFFHIFLILLNL